ncbi:MAG TPA: LacI family DNA-binding transcriptional regulator [Streptosporangiaceae bacterium]|nr:LacI family DNA-binding transcriptional regulator [Streptosporangiaceae bacterium]
MAVTGPTSGQAPPPGDGAQGRGLRPASILDVAAAAGVSYQTVSRVINGHPNVKPATRELVLAAIQQLGFRPNRAARLLRGGLARSVTVLTPNTSLYGYQAALQGIEEAARAAGFAVGVRVVESAVPAEVADAVTRAIGPGGSLIVIAYDQAGRMTLDAVPPDIPMMAMVEAPASDPGPERPWVWLDDRKAAVEATRYLLSLGHSTVHYLAIPSSTHASQRQAGWREALEEAGAPVPAPRQCGWTPRSGYEAGQALATDPAVTAVLCGNDDLALGVMRAMHAAGRAIPGDVSVVGFDDMPVAEFLTPPLTTVRLDFAELGRVCFALLLALMERKETLPHVRRPEPELIIRESAGRHQLPRGSGMTRAAGT